MLKSRSYRRQIKILGPALAVIFGMAVVLLATVGLLRVFADVDIGELTRDPIHKTGLHPFVGFISNLGVLFWAFAAATCLFTAFVLRRSGRPRRDVNFFLIAGIITTWLMLDDIFLFHDVILREYVGIPEAVSYPIYILGVAVFFYAYRDRVRDSEYVILFLAGGLFLFSMVFDFINDQELVNGGYLFEDGFKFLGIIAWLVYFTRTSFAEVMGARAVVRRSRMRDGICNRCGSGNVIIVRSRTEPEVPVVPLAASYRYEKPVVRPLSSDHLKLECNDCHYSEFYLNDSTKVVSIGEERRKTG